jgi:dihydrofolate reductase
MRTSLIVAADLDDCIGRSGELPWHLPSDISVVVTRWAALSRGAEVTVPSPSIAHESALAIEAWAGRDEVFVIGGARVYESLLDQVDRIYLTRVNTRADGDAFMPAGWLQGFTLGETEPLHERDGDQFGYQFGVYDRMPA